MDLTDKQHAFFDTFGYLVVRGLLSPAEIDQVTEAFEWSIQSCGGGKDHDGNCNYVGTYMTARDAAMAFLTSRNHFENYANYIYICIIYHLSEI